jgi:hypothetical protein
MKLALGALVVVAFLWPRSSGAQGQRSYDDRSANQSYGASQNR